MRVRGRGGGRASAHRRRELRPVSQGADNHFMGEEVESKEMALRYAGRCRACGREIPARERAIYERASKTVRCLECPTAEPTAASPLAASPPSTPPPMVPAAPVVDSAPPVESGSAGASARREYERRRARDEERLRAQWGKLGGIAVALSDEKQSTSAWATGAVGEERLGARLDSLASDSIAVLHDRRIPGSRANIDHIIVTPGRVWVVDAKRYKGRPDLRIEGGLIRPRVEKLTVGRRDCTKLVDGVLKQVALVQELLPGVPLCFVEADWPLIGGAFTTRGVHVLWPKRLAKLLTESRGPLDVAMASGTLAARFKPA